MKAFTRVLFVTAPAVLLILLCGFAPAPKIAFGTVFVVTAAPAYDSLAALRGGERFPQGAQLLVVENGQAKPLVDGFYATADADVSFDAKRILFAGKQSADSPWQIWEMVLVDRSLRKVISGVADAVRPLYLPGNRFVYAERHENSFSMRAANLDGTAALQITHIPASAIPSTVLRDGRILFEAGYPLGSGDTPELFLVYSDGSGVESYRCDHGQARWGGTQLRSGDVVFTHGATLARFSSPFAEETRVIAPRADYAGSIAETASGEWLVSAKTSGSSHFTVKLWKPGSSILQPILTHGDEDLLSPVLLVPRTLPNRHPSALHEWSTANLLALDARQTRTGVLERAPASVQVESINASGKPILLGTAPIESDGSFFIKIPGDQPIRFAVMDARGAVIQQERGWFWSRSGEQRICVGCHTGPEHAPENRVPGVLLRTTTPVDLSGPAPSSTSQQPAAGGN